jgi:hypothetical protein
VSAAIDHLMQALEAAANDRRRDRAWDVAAGFAGWNNLPPLVREPWMSTAASAVPANCWAAYKTWGPRQAGSTTCVPVSDGAWKP